MKIIIFLLIFTFSSVCNAEIISDSYDIPEFSPGELVVKISPNTSLREFKVLNDQMNAFNAKKAFPNFNASIPLGRVYIIRFALDSDIQEISRQYANHSIIEAAQPNYLREPRAEEIIPNDEKFEKLWNLEKIDMPKAWAIEKGNPDVVIAIIDGGVDYRHPDLKSKIWSNEDEIPSNGIDDDKNGYVDDRIGWDFTDAKTLPGKGDFVERDNDPMDESGHGTHVAGIAGAQVNNKIGIAGVAWQCKIMAIRSGASLISGGSRLQDDDSAAAIIYAADNGANVINMSWGDYQNSFIIRDAVDYAYERGCVLVGAAGNGYSPQVIFPAGYSNVISVASINQLDSRYYGSNYGSAIDVGAPGNLIISTLPGNKYGSLTGTSMASPHVAGTVALMLSKRPGLTNQEVLQIIVYSAEPAVDSPELVGAGRLNVAKALLNSSSLQANIIKPEPQEGSDQSIEIIGSAGGFGFTNWYLQYGKSTVPDSWFDIATGRNTRFDQTIHIWDTSNVQEGIYTLRLRTIGVDKFSEDKTIVHIDHSPPIIIEQDASKWLVNQYQATNVIWQTDELCRSEFYYRPFGSNNIPFESLSSNTISRMHFFSLSNELISGDYEFFISSENLSGLHSVDDNNGNFHKITVFTDVISPSKFISEKTNLPAMYSITADADLDGDLISEIIGTQIDGFSHVKIYESSENGYDLVFTSSEKYLPLEFCDLDKDGQWEILGAVYRRIFLLESPTKTGSYPVRKIWETQGCLCSKTAELNGNGMGEIITFSKNNEIIIYEAFGNDDYREIANLPNPTDGQNIMQTDSAVDDFDGNGKMELVVADSDGDIFAYEKQDANRFRHMWTIRTDIRLSHEMDTGNLIHDEKPELIVGGLVLDGEGRPAYWKFSLFGVRQDGQVYEIANQKAQNFYSNSKCDVMFDDLDKDGSNEILIAVPPNAYVLKLENDGILKPVWHHSVESAPVVYSQDGFYFNDSGEFTRFVYMPDNMQSTPYALNAIPINENNISLHWKSDIPQSSYTVYRGVTDEDDEKPTFLEAIASDISNEFTDKNVTKDEVYWYVVTASSLYDTRISIKTVENNSNFSDLVSVVPDNPPELLSAKYIEPDRVCLEFDKQMSNSLGNINLYSVIEQASSPDEKYHPSSAILVEMSHKLILTFEKGIFTAGQTYILEFKELRSKNRVALDLTEIQFTVPGTSVQQRILSKAIVYPNPVRPNKNNVGYVTFDNLPTGTTIRIYNVNGLLLEEMKVTESNKGKIDWFLTNHEGNVVSSGIYVYTLEYENMTKTGKIVVIK